MNFAVQWFKGDPSGIPDGWPKLVRPLGEAKGPLLGEEVLQTREELEAVCKSLQSAMDERDATQALAVTTAAKSRDVLLQSAADEARSVLDNWASITAAQQKAILKRVVQVILLLITEDRV